MGIEENKLAARRLMEEVYNGDNLSLIPELVSPDFVAHVTPEYRGHEGLKQHIVESRKAFPDMHFTIDNILAEGDMVAWRVTMKATHKGNLGEIAPTGNTISYTAIAISRYSDGKEVERWQEMNPLDLYQQLGISPAN